MPVRISQDVYRDLDAEAYRRRLAGRRVSKLTLLEEAWDFYRRHAPARGTSELAVPAKALVVDPPIAIPDGAKAHATRIFGLLMDRRLSVEHRIAVNTLLALFLDCPERERLFVEYVTFQLVNLADVAQVGKTA